MVAKLVEAAQKEHNHRYSASRGIPNLRKAVADRYQRRFGVTLDPDTEVINAIGATEGRIAQGIRGIKTALNSLG